MSKVMNMVGGSAVKPVFLIIKTPPIKTQYFVGESFSPEGMLLEAVYSNGKTVSVTDYTVYPSVALAMGTTEIEIKYTDKGTTVTAKIDISVRRPYDATFANNSWADIIEACHTNDVPSTWVVGNYKNMMIGSTEYRIDIIGKNHDTYSAGGTAPLTFQMHDSYIGGKTMNNTDTNVGGWRDSLMRTSHLPGFLALLPKEVSEGIRAVNKKTTLGGQSNSVVTTEDKLFLLSEIEIFGTITYSKSGEGSRYAYYAAGNSAAKTTNGNVNVWWERSPYKLNNTDFCRVGGTGSPSYDEASSDPAVAFAFCF